MLRFPRHRESKVRQDPLLSQEKSWARLDAKEGECPQRLQIPPLSGNKKIFHILHDDEKRGLRLKVDVTQLFTAAFPLRDICPEGISAPYLLSPASVAPNTPHYVNRTSTLGKREMITDNENMFSGGERRSAERSYTMKSWRHFYWSLNIEVGKSLVNNARRHKRPILKEILYVLY